jgi:transcriptional regulator with XRE-family HTH domain
MGRSNRNDEAFKQRIAKEFQRGLSEARRKGLTVEQFAATLRITRAAVYRILNGEVIPSLRVLQKARSRWGIRFSYGDLGDRYISGGTTDPRQAEFQFSVHDVSKDQIEVTKLSPKGENSLELVIRIGFSKTA